MSLKRALLKIFRKPAFHINWSAYSLLQRTSRTEKPKYADVCKEIRRRRRNLERWQVAHREKPVDAKVINIKDRCK